MAACTSRMVQPRRRRVLLTIVLVWCCFPSVAGFALRTSSKSSRGDVSTIMLLHSTTPRTTEHQAPPRTGPAQWLLNVALASPLWKHVLVPQARRTMVQTAEANGIQWSKHLDWIRSQEGPWQSDERMMAVNVPDYYQKCFHAYDKGNLCWEAALEVEIASRAVGARNFPAFGSSGEDAFRDSFQQALVEAGAVSSPHKIVDMGCGTGMSTRRLAQQHRDCQEIIGIDLSPHYIEVGKKLLQLAPKGSQDEGPWVTSVLSDDRIDYRVGNAAQTHLPDDSVDVVNLMFVLHELPAEASMEIITEAWRILKPNGGQLWICEMDFEAPAYAAQRANPLLFSLIRATEPYLDEYANGFADILQHVVGTFSRVKLTAATGRHYALVATKGSNKQEGNGTLEDLRFNSDGTYRIEDTHLKVWESKQEEK